MFGLYLRLLLFVAGLVGAVILFAFTFTAAAIVLVVVLVVLALTGRAPKVDWWVQRGTTFERDPGATDARKPPLIIDHDPNDLPDNKS